MTTPICAHAHILTRASWPFHGRDLERACRLEACERQMGEELSRFQTPDDRVELHDVIGQLKTDAWGSFRRSLVAGTNLERSRGTAAGTHTQPTDRPPPVAIGDRTRSRYAT